MVADVMPGCEPVSHVAGALAGCLIVHGFTGNPSSMRGVANAMIAAGFDVELPRLPGHGTSIDDMMATGWADWCGEVEVHYRALLARCDRVVVVGQSMGATLVLALALAHPEIAGVVCINPVTRLRDAETMEMLDDFLDDGITIAPGDESDIADPDSSDIAYRGTPLGPLRSLLDDGVAPMTDRFGELAMPLRVFTSRQDHVVEPDDSVHLVSTYGGSVEHTWLERSFHVATLDFDRDLVVSGTLDFARRVTR